MMAEAFFLGTKATPDLRKDSGRVLNKKNQNQQICLFHTVSTVPFQVYF